MFLALIKLFPCIECCLKRSLSSYFALWIQKNLVGGSQYYDGQVTLAERLCLENIFSAQNAGATVLNYVEVTELPIKDSRIVEVVCKDKLTGESFTISGSDNAVVINTAGPWIDRVCQLGSKAGNKTPIGDTKKNGGTKGSHIVVGKFPGAPGSTLYVEAKSDGRPFLYCPLVGNVSDRHY